MKRILCACLLLALLLGASGASAATLSKAEVGALVLDMYAEYESMYTLNTLSAGGTPPLSMVVSNAPMRSILGSVEYRIGEKQKLETGSRGVVKQFQEVFATAYQLTKSFDYVTIFDVDTYENTYKKQVTLSVLGSDWFCLGETDDGAEILVGPVALADENRNIIDDVFYSFVMFSEAGQTRLWVCSDEAIVSQLFVGLGLDKLRATNDVERKLQAWMLEREAYYGAQTRDLFLLSETTDPNYKVDETAYQALKTLRESIIGTVTITNTTAVNLREADNAESSKVGNANPGDTFLTTGLTDNNWYGIVMPDETIAYVSGKMATLTETLEGGDGEASAEEASDEEADETEETEAEASPAPEEEATEAPAEPEENGGE